MKELLLFSGLGIIGIILLAFGIDHAHHKTHYISFPEEYKSIEVGDTLMKYERDDTTFIYFKHYCPPCKEWIVSKN